MVHINAIRYSAKKLREVVFESYVQIGICANIYNHNGKQHNMVYIRRVLSYLVNFYLWLSLILMFIQRFNRDSHGLIADHMLIVLE